MPLRRTPPSTPTNTETHIPDSNINAQLATQIGTPYLLASVGEPYSKLQTLKMTPSGSAPNLTNLLNENVSNRKRKHEDEQARFMSEMQKLFGSHSERCEARSCKTDDALVVLQNMMHELLKQNTEIKQSITFVSQQYEDMRSRVDLLESENKENHTHIHQLEEKIDSMERMLYSRKLEIKNVPISINEDVESLSTIVLNTVSAIGVHLQRSDIKEVSCTNKKETQSKIIVELTSAAVKENIIKKTRQFNFNNKQCKLSSSHINMDGPTVPIYVSDFLPPLTQHNFYLARKFAKAHNYMYCWTSSGKVFLRKTEAEKPIIIRCEADLVNLLPKK